MQERQIDLSAQVARVKHKARPWKSIIALVLAIASAVISHAARRHDANTFPTTNHLTNLVVAYCAAALFGVFGCIATVGLAGKAREVLEPRAGTAHSAVVRYAILILAGFTVLVITLDLFAVPVDQLVLGGALTSVFVGIAAQQALGNLFAGLVLQFARPFRVGDLVRLRAGALGGTLDGTVTDIGITYVRLDTGGSVMSIPNSQVLNAVVGPVPPDNGGPDAPDNGGPVAVSEGKSGTPDAPGQSQPGPQGPV